ncbi:MAG: uridine kinase [Deltaproteobacteria bacterium]|nr:uridine kinase [Deltaproteobacteria bacterium]MBL7110822.1 uridine kinase [Bacteroidales bacterium]
MLTIGISGGSGSGKSTVVNELINRLPAEAVSLIPQDSYYWDNGEKTPEEKQNINFDHPDAIEWPLLIAQFKALKNGNSIKMPVYSYVTCARSRETELVVPRKIIIVEGILILTEPELVDLLDIKIFVDADPDERLMRIIRRDIEERGRTFDQGMHHYETFVKPMHLQFVEPSRRFADIIVPQGGKNSVAMDILASRINPSNQHFSLHPQDQDGKR